MKKTNRRASVSSRLLRAAVVLILPAAAYAGAPILSGVNPTLTPAIAKGNANPPGYTVSTFLNPIVTDGTLLDDFESNTAVNKWGGTWFTTNDNGAGGLSTINPPYLTFAASAPGYNSAYCAKVNVALHKGGLAYNPYALLTVNLNPASTTIATVPVDLTRATGFRYWYKGGKHYFKVETTNINPGAASFYQDSVPASPTVWTHVIFTWDSLHSLNYGTGVVSPVTAAAKQVATRLSWVIQGADATVDSMFIDNVEVTGFPDRGIAVTGADNANGAWQFSTDAGTTWTPFGALTDLSATLLYATSQVRFVPVATYSGPSTFIFRAWNQTDNKANGSAGNPVNINGGITAYSAIPATATVQVQGGNAPVITTQPASTVTANEGGTLTLSVVATNTTAYQWNKGGAAIAGAITATYTKTGVVAGDAGTYTVMVKNATDSLLSSQSVVTVRLKPANATVTPAARTILVGDSVTFAVNVAAGTAPFTYQWMQNLVNINGATGATYHIASAVLASAGTYSVTVSNAAGPTTSSGGVLTVNTPIKAVFTMSDSIVKVPATISFNSSQSTGLFTKRIWYFGDGAVDTSNIPNPTHGYNASGVFPVMLVLMNGAVRQDSMVQYVKAYKDNPIVISGRFSFRGNAEITFSNYGSNLISTGVVPPYADSMRLYYKSGSIPTTVAGAAFASQYSIAAMQQAAAPYKVIVPAALAGTDTVIGFMTQVHWNNGTIWYWSNFDPGNGTLVIMTDTTTPGNATLPSGRYIQGTDSVVFAVSGLGTLDTSYIDSFVIWYGTSITDVTPDFTDAAHTKRFKLDSQWTTILASNGRDSAMVKDPQFNTGVQKKLVCAVELVGRNHKKSAAVQTFFNAGMNRPTNMLVYTAKAVGPTQVLLSWQPVGNVSAIRFWYSTSGKIPGNQTEFPSPPYDSISAKSVTDLQLTVPGLHDNTTYYFASQVFSGGLWSFVDTIGVNATTPLASGKLPVNTVGIKSCVFNTTDNAIHVSWTVGYTLTDTLEIGISYSLAGYPTNDTSAWQIVPVTAGSGTAVIKLREPLVFSADTVNNPTFYYVALWERRHNGALTDPTDSSRVKVMSPTFNWQAIKFFTASPGDMNSVFNGNILIVTDSVAPGDVSPANAVIQYGYNGAVPNFSGFIPVSIPFYFSQKDQTGKFMIELKLSGVPAAYTSSAIRIYQCKNGLWYVDRGSTADNTYAYTKTTDPDFLYPLMALIDTMPPTFTRGLHADTLLPGTDVFDTIKIADNCANVTYSYLFTRGGQAFSKGDAKSGTLAGLSVLDTVVIPGTYVASDNGLRAAVVVSDGVHTVTWNVSRQVRRDNSDVVQTLENTWTPLRVTAALDTGDIAWGFYRGTPGTPWVYDKKQMRMFRWFPNTENLTSTSKWVEYSNATANDFAMSPGALVWEKGRTSVPVNFGTGVTPTLRTAYPILLPAANWTDFALPFRFDVTVGDIIDSTVAVPDTLQFYSWVEDATSHKFTTNALYIELFASLGIANKGTTLSSQILTGYSVYNPLAVPVQLRIPPIPSTMSSHMSKRVAGSGWALSITSKLSDGSQLSPVFCGYSPAKGTATSFLPVPPSFEKQYAGVFDTDKKKVFGHALSHDMKDGGCAFVLAFVNDGEQAATISYRLGNLSALPKGLVARTFNEKTGASDDFSSGAATVTVPAGGMELKVLAVGSPTFLAKEAIVLKSATLAFVGVSPNPASSLVRIRYSVPNAGVNSVKFSIYDMRGRIVWQRAVYEHGNGGVRETTWDGTSLDKRRVAAGAYVVRMTALDGNNRPGGVFERRITYLP